MIPPLSLPDHTVATDDQIVAAYIAEGETDEEARLLLSIIRRPPPAGCFVE